MSKWSFDYANGEYFGSGVLSPVSSYDGIDLPPDRASLVFPGLPQWQARSRDGSLNTNIQNDLMTGTYGEERASGTHRGTDYAIFGPMVAPFDGVVTAVGSAKGRGNYISVRGTGEFADLEITYFHLGNKTSNAPRTVRRTVFDGTWLNTYFSDVDVGYETSLDAGSQVLTPALPVVRSTPVMDGSRTYDAWDLITLAALNFGPNKVAVLGLFTPSPLGDDDDFTPTTIYTYRLQVGDYVPAGAILGFSGNTGNVSSRLPDASHTGTHLHMEAKVKNQFGAWVHIDPASLNWRVRL